MILCDPTRFARLINANATEPFFASNALRPVNKLTEATKKVTAQGLIHRISADGEHREFVALIDVFKSMMARLERSFQQAHRFTADAAHKLKTPLAIVQGQLERTIGQAEDGSPLQAALGSMLDEVRRLSVISRKLLLSQADVGRLTVFREHMDLSRVLDDLLEDTCMLAPNLSIEGKIQPGLLFNADASLLRQVLHNLISNAIKYNVDGGWINVAAMHSGKRIEVVTRNASAAIAKGDQGKLFERLFQGRFSPQPPSRGRRFGP